MHLVSYLGHIKIAKLLILNGADLDIKNNKGEIFLNFVKNKEIKEIVEDFNFIRPYRGI